MRSNVKVGLFVLFGLVLVGVVIFMIGDERHAFARSVDFRAEFSNVADLKSGAPVSMGGVRIGKVSEVTYGDDPADGTVYVTLSIVASSARRIRSDSRVTIVNKGFLGDKMVVINKGTEGDELDEGDLIPSEEPGDVFGRFDNITSTAETTLRDVSGVAKELSDEGLHDDLKQSVRSFKLLLRQATEGDGYPHKFLTDKEEAERISRTIDSLNHSSAELNATLREIRLAVNEVRTGDGFAHDLLFGDGPQEQLAAFSDAAGEVAVTLKGVREGDGFARDVLFGSDDKTTRDALSNLTEITADVRDIVKSVKNGKGTLGALLVDPSIYEDLKRVVGNVERNAVLRALVRYSIKADEEQPELSVGSADRQ